MLQISDRIANLREEALVKREYEKLYKIIETETNFYLMISKTQGFVLVKNNMPEGLVEFIKTIQ